MKKIIYATVLAFIIVFTISCSSDSDDGMEPNNPVIVTYNNTIKGIISGNCLSCHGNPTANGAPMTLTTYDDVKNAVQNRGLIGRIEAGTMPLNGSPLSSSQVQAFKNWQAGGFDQ